jgi:hypothetical protein
MLPGTFGLIETSSAVAAYTRPRNRTVMSNYRENQKENYKEAGE